MFLTLVQVSQNMKFCQVECQHPWTEVTMEDLVVFRDIQGLGFDTIG